MKLVPTVVRSSIEVLEPRIAPASVFTYTDIDGDKVTIKSTRGDLTGHVTLSGGTSGQLLLLDLSDASFAAASISFKVTKSGIGDGLAAVGRINGGTNDFKDILIKGDLGGIAAGSGTSGKLAIKSLTTRSMGLYGFATQGAGDLVSDIVGGVGKLKVVGDVKGVTLRITDFQTGNIGSLVIGGSLIGGLGENSGFIQVDGTIRSAKIGKDVIGGAGARSGTILSASGIEKITIGGSIYGGAGSSSGLIASEGRIGKAQVAGNVNGGESLFAGGIRGVEIGTIRLSGSLLGGSGTQAGMLAGNSGVGTVIIGGNIVGGDGDLAGAIFSNNGSIERVKVQGSLIGTFGRLSGSIRAAGDVGKVEIGGDLRGGSIEEGASNPFGSGLIRANRIGSVLIKGSVIAGFDNSAGAHVMNASIVADFDIGSITVRGDVLGTFGINGDLTRPMFLAVGQENPTATKNVAIGKISIGGSVQHASIRAGHSSDFPINGDAQIGSVTVRGDWIASDLVAGVQDGGAPGFGDDGDSIIAGGSGIAKIAKIQIAGMIAGSATAGDRFGIESAAIGELKVGRVRLSVPPSPGFVPLSPITGDVFARLV